ncbi:S8 family serine peptidase [Streptomyces sp. NBC_01689]|uniref:S8 family serine peptidase n=1 Tax=Streptomyces sp. NBC_01689 TaxID=2975911 RepID=UPI002E336AF7|nr:S8 family serine peptidase [Streptomyces sp. NBC_01689]
MSFPPFRRRRLMALCTATAVLAVTPALASAAPAPPSPARSTASAADVPTALGTARSVTLVTGDKVTVTRAADGTSSRTVRDPDGRYTGFETNQAGKDTYVYPHSALPYVAAGLLDKELFNVTRLLADDYDDAHSDRLPLIVTYTDAAARSRTLAVPKGAHKVRALDSIQGAALGADRSDAFWTSVTGGGAEAAARDTGARPALKAGIAKVWLDGRVKADLADSTRQIGAPQVWASGNTGKGVDVAVLDTGVDADHPDLSGQVAASEDFVPGESVVDRNGHGTHVASTIAGTGAASDGKERGVAPGAKLHIGKVLSDDGYGQDSWVLAGMEWAARDQHAKIISMSLGGGPTDGTDPLSQAVDSLSEETGALFTIAAGNAGPDRYSVGAPGAADAALTVGAVDGSDSLADFSSRGPRAGDGAVKPDLTAPGVDILAARSQYSPEGSGSYQTMSGTSMATPHVAGAAALLAAAHPDWTGRQLKNALVSTTEATPKYSPFEGGTGRLDIATTTTATTFATGSADFGFRTWPTPAGTSTDREVTYTNTSGDPVALDLTARASGTDAAPFTLSASRVTVPAHGTASVTVTAHYDAIAKDQVVAGFLTATGPSGTVLTRTSLSAGKEGERHQLTLKAKDRGGKPVGGTVILTAKKLWLPVRIDESGTLDLRLPPGSYTAWMEADLEGSHGPHSLGLGLMAVSDVVLDQDRTAVFDATRARQVRTVTPRPSTVDGSRIEYYRGFADDDWSSSSRWPGTAYDSVWALPTKKVAEGEFVLGTRWRTEEPALTVASGDRTFGDLLVHRGATPLARGGHRLDAVFAGDGGASAYRSLDARGRAVVVRRNDTVPVEEQAAAAVSAGAGLLLVVNDGTGRLDPWNDSPYGTPNPPPLTVASLTRDEGEQLIAGLGRNRTRLDVSSSPTTDYVYELVHDYKGAVPAEPVHRVEQRELARVDVSFRNFRAGRALDYREDVARSGPSALNPSIAPALGERTDYVTAGERWAARAQIPGEQQQYAQPESYRAGTTSVVRWFGPVQRPRLGDGDAPVRQDDTLYVGIPAWGDSGNGHLGATYGNFGVSNLLKLYQGDRLVQETSRYQLSMTVAGLAPEPLPYRLVSENDRDAWAGPYSTSTRTEWGFTSRAGGAGELVQMPLIQLDYAVGTDVSGRAGRHSDLTVTASHLSASSGTAAIRTVGLEVSYDDGATWRAAPLRHVGDGWRTSLDAPRTARFVTLRTTARDARGNSVDQRVTRAFGLK